MKSYYISISCLLLFTNLLIAQAGYEPFKEYEDFKEKMVDELEIRFNQDLETLNKPYLKQKKKIYTNRFEGLSDKILYGEMISSPDFNDYFNGIFQHIIDSNPKLKNRDLRLLIGKYGWPNASCHGEGSIVVNLGLIARLKSEDQIAFVLCHELVHDLENHVNNSIDENLEKLYGKETQKKLKELKKKKNNFDEVFGLIKVLTFNNRLHGRLHEFEADSKAMELMKNTKYDTKEAMECLKILDKIDEPLRPQEIDFKKHFDTEEFQIKDRWLQTEESNGLIYKELTKEEKDSLKTHPDCEKRIAAIKDFNHTIDRKPQTEAFIKIVQLADYEIIEGEYLSKNYGRALFHSFLLLDENPQDAYLHSMVLWCLYQLHEYQKKHELGKVMTLPHRNYDKNYNQFLSFFHNLRLRDLAKLGYHYGKKNAERFQNAEPFRAAQVFASYPVMTAADWKGMKRKYYSDFPKGTYKSEVKEFQPIFNK